MADSSSDEENARRKSTRQRRNPFDKPYWELGEPPMSPTDERESDRESVDTLPARRQDVYTAWNKGGRVDVYELEAAFTRRLKRSLDALRKRRCQPDSHFDDSDEPSTEPSSSRPREE
ncbi:hypothetical protein SprV_0100321700 [Sparganum proliferum]